jgi:hypothetical protein
VTPRPTKKQRVITRRQALRGLGGLTIGLPFLPSLVPGRAYGQEPSFAAPPRFLAMTTEHGGLFESAMFPDPALTSDSMALYSGHEIRSGALQLTQSGDEALLSTVLRGPSDKLTPALAAKMNVLWGLDIPFYIAHHTGGHLGNYARNDGNGSAGQEVQQYFMPTIDQLMAWSDTFYPDLAGISQRAIVAGARNGLSWNWSNPSDRQGTIEEVRNTFDAIDVFNQLFTSGATPAPSRPSIVDRVVESYRNLRDGNRRLSSADRQRLDDHMDRLAELQRRVDALAAARAACGDPIAPPRADNDPDNLALLVDVIANAFICGASRIAVLGVIDERFSSFTGDWHQEVAHRWSEPDAQPLLQGSHGAAFSRVFLELASRLEVEEAPGVTVLDNTLMTWSQESGEATHEARSIPVVTFGSAGGFLRTGQFVDYRNLSPTGMRTSYGEEAGNSGLLYSQWLATCLQAMRLPASEWQDVEHNGATGYGYPLIDETYAPTHATGVVENASEVLPLLEA